ncbi:MAG: cobalamin B12-binding domain-containing protein [Pseudomonadota bacterium]
MTAKTDKSTLQAKSGQLVDRLAQSAILHLGATGSTTRPRRLDVGTKALIEAVLDRASFDAEAVWGDLERLRLSRIDMFDHCIPEAATALGEGWLQDEITFAGVSNASSRLFGMCKEIGGEWHNLTTDDDTSSILLATIDREDHVIGPSILAEQMRRRGHSVYMMHNVDAARIRTRLRNVRHDAVMISAASYQSLDLASEAIRSLVYEGVDVPVILGGAILEFEDGLEHKTGADLVTNDLDKALAAVATARAAQ